MLRLTPIKRLGMMQEHVQMFNYMLFFILIIGISNLVPRSFSMLQAEKKLGLFKMNCSPLLANAAPSS